MQLQFRNSLGEIVAEGEGRDGEIIERAHKEGTDLSWLLQPHLNLHSKEMSGAKLSQSLLPNLCMDKANMAGAVLPKALIPEARANGANLKGAFANQARFYDSTFGGQAIWDNLNCRSAVFDGCTIDGVSALDIHGEGASFLRSYVSNVTFSGDLKGVRFTGSRLIGVTFKDCDLTGVSFDGCFFSGTKFEKCIIAGTSWSGIVCAENGIEGVNPALLTPMSVMLRQKGVIRMLYIPLQSPPEPEKKEVKQHCPQCQSEQVTLGQLEGSVNYDGEGYKCNTCGTIFPKEEEPTKQEEPKPDGADLKTPSIRPDFLAPGKLLKCKKDEAFKVGTESHWLRHNINTMFEVEFKVNDIVKVPLGSGDHLYIKRMKLVEVVRQV